MEVLQQQDFNSYMVQLKQEHGKKVAAVVAVFQFLYGPIKARSKHAKKSCVTAFYNPSNLIFSSQEIVDVIWYDFAGAATTLIAC